MDDKGIITTDALSKKGFLINNKKESLEDKYVEGSLLNEHYY